MIRVLLADDHQIITEGITNLLENVPNISIVSTCRNGQEVLECVANLQVDLILLDIDMPIMNGFDCAKQLQIKYPDIKIIMLTMHEEKSLIKSFMEMGVKGYFLKTVDKEELIFGLKKIANGDDYFTSDVTKVLLNTEEAKSTIPDDLSKREIEIIKLIASGMTNKEIAKELFISPKTVDTHRTNIMRKLEIHNVAGLVRFAFKHQLVTT
ncbi:MAG: response regulator [Crocinitomicaceae bacterium]